MNNNFNISITAKISPEAALEKINQIPKWWGVIIEGNTAKLNDQFVIKMGSEAFFNCTITEMIPGKRVVWAIGDCYMPWYKNKKEWSDTRLIFEITENNITTEVHFIHEGLTSELECYNDCKPGWTHWIQNSLFSYFTTGEGDFKQR